MKSTSGGALRKSSSQIVCVVAELGFLHRGLEFVGGHVGLTRFFGESFGGIRLARKAPRNVYCVVFVVTVVIILVVVDISSV